MASLIWIRVLAAGGVGLIAWCGPLWAIPVSILAPCLIAVQPTRAAAGAASFAYYAAPSSPVIAVAKAYWPSSDAGAVLMWLAAPAILSLPWVLCWTRRESLRPWTAAIAVVLTAVPPLCIVGWASPLLSAGVLFPNTGWLGLAAVLALPGLLLHEGGRAITLLTAAATSLLLNAGEATHYTSRLGSGDDAYPPPGEGGRFCRLHHRGTTPACRVVLPWEISRFSRSRGPPLDCCDGRLLGRATFDCREDAVDRRQPADPRLFPVPQLRGDRRQALAPTVPSANSRPRRNVESAPARGRLRAGPLWLRDR